MGSTHKKGFLIGSNKSMMNAVSMMDKGKNLPCLFDFTLCLDRRVLFCMNGCMLANDPSPQCRWNCENNAPAQCMMWQERLEKRGEIRIPAIVRDRLPSNCKWTYGTCCLNKSFCLKGSNKLCNGNKIFEPDEKFEPRCHARVMDGCNDRNYYTYSPI